ncbi:MAG: metal ABC transporter ATP-binding protein [Thermoguttaceae bacterium]|nr:metal ABC transporter ATP-binding protein [Thermoguttaceae bacterium]
MNETMFLETAAPSPTADRPEILTVQDLTFAYRREMPILKSVTFSASEGDFAAVIGSNGAGKSTLMKLILNQLTPTSGEVCLFGENVRTFRNWPLLGYVPQGNSYLNSEFPASVEEVLLAHQFPQIGLFRRAKRQHRERVGEVLALVGMEDFRTARIGTLSGGQLQRVLIARALVNHPKLLILDEPTTGIDVQNAHALYELLARLNRELKLTILMVTHDLVHAVNYARTIFCIEDGNLAAVPPKELEHELAHRHHHAGKDECEHVQAIETHHSACCSCTCTHTEE